MSNEEILRIKINARRAALETASRNYNLPEKELLKTAEKLYEFLVSDLV